MRLTGSGAISCRLACLGGLCDVWSPGYDASEDLPKVKECIRDPAHFKAALGYYWGQFDPNRFGSEEWAAEQNSWPHSSATPFNTTATIRHRPSRTQSPRPASGKPPVPDTPTSGPGHLQMPQASDADHASGSEDNAGQKQGDLEAAKE